MTWQELFLITVLVGFVVYLKWLSWYMDARCCGSTRPCRHSKLHLPAELPKAKVVQR